ncbi:diguanylate cyclase (GGDEF)-like protein [Pseudoteredinibacter isoporae]|uniref:diguanylate cyclase n=2 Tax=Pseudoteredinibacter isoporae TaxID=570281 RepID=A0A7X0MXT9_9GAMM|nr:diguanylate cyclase (GGDEF)-like protein [Pseudoteredinibacter isoporae]
MIDIDYFKRINDRYGHSTGDNVIRDVGRAIKDNFRSTDIVGRVGGEEFSVILPETKISNAIYITEKLRTNIECLVFHANNEKIKITVSIGIAEYTCNGESIESITKYADKALYTAKRSGRNRLMVYKP